MPTSSVLPGQTQLDQALQEMQVGDTMQLLGTVNGVRMYAARNAAGHICLAIDHVAQTYEKGVFCDLNEPGFPSADEQALSFPGSSRASPPTASRRSRSPTPTARSSTARRSSTTCSRRARGSVSASPTYIEALDANGNVLSKRKLAG